MFAGLLCSGYDAIGRTWDIRTGRTAMVLDGHVREILALDFAPNGYQVAAGSGDDSIRIWDLRALKVLHSIPAHKSSVSDLCFFRPSNEVDLTGITPQANGNANANGALNDDQEDVDMSTDKPDIEKPSSIGRTGLYLASSGFDHTVKLWSADDWQLINSFRMGDSKVMSVDISGDGKYIGAGSYSRSFHLFASEDM